MTDEQSTDDTSYDRTVLAEERTFSAWVRTGLAGVATGVAIVKLLPDSEPRWLLQLLGGVFIVVGGIAFGLGYWAYRDALLKWKKATPRAMPFWLIAGVRFLLVISAVLALSLVILD